MKRWCLSEGTYSEHTWILTYSKVTDVGIKLPEIDHSVKENVPYFSCYFFILMRLRDQSLRSQKHSFLSYNVYFIISLSRQ